jgi:hypothetical protein
MIGLNTFNKLRIYCTLKKKVNNISDSVKKVTMKIKEIAQSVLHFALKISLISKNILFIDSMTVVLVIKGFAIKLC